MPPDRTVSDGDVQHVGYIGLGNAGYSMASNLPKAGYKLVVHDADQTRADRAAKEWPNTVAAQGHAEAFANCEVIVTMLPQGKVVREVLFGEKGIAKALKPGTIIVDTSSSSPFDTISLGEELAKHSLQLVDSPITQTYMHATDAGESTLMVGSDSEAVFEKVKPILQTMASYVFHMGGLGKGHAMKTLNNYIMASSIIALSDSLVTGQKFGLDPQQMLDVLNVGTGVCFPTLDTFRRDGLTKKYNSGFGLALLVKDLGITKDFMAYNQFQTDLPDVIEKYLKSALDQVDRQADHTEVLKSWEERSGVELRISAQISTIPKDDFEHRWKGLNRP